VPYQPNEQTVRQLQAVVDSLPHTIARPSLEGLTLYKAGTSNNNPFGYSGQLALREQFQMTGKIRELLESGKAASTQQIEEAAVLSGMKTMLHDAVLKVIAGETTLEEVYRVLD
jgi:type II secretory ATPase GspE/PulE/Tfp pilus assembly ATPase PilB-like protein